uniref:Transmembrane protein 255B n=1 Tax=Canis lupus dingo TaxID=286419 RepID=A0A8C0KTL3_CANLU
MGRVRSPFCSPGTSPVGPFVLTQLAPCTPPTPCLLLPRTRPLPPLSQLSLQTFPDLVCTDGGFSPRFGCSRVPASTPSGALVPGAPGALTDTALGTRPEGHGCTVLSRRGRFGTGQRGCCSLSGGPASPIPLSRLLICPSSRRVCEEEEDLPLVCGVSTRGVCLHPDRRPDCHHQDREPCNAHSLLCPLPQLFAAIVFISFGVVAAFCCAIVDGVFAARHIEPRPLTAGRCQFFASEVGYVHDTYQTEVTCHSSNGQCQLKVRSSTCYCCDLYNCQSTEHPPAYYEFVGVHRCQDVLHLYRLLWASALLNVLGVLLGIVTAAVLGAFKDMVPLSQLAYGPSALPQILYNPAQQILAYTGFCPSPATLPTCSSYPLPLQRCGGFPASTPRDPPLSEDVQPPNTPSLCAPAHFLPGEKPPPYTP